MEKISIIIPCYNVENLVGRCLDSVFAQTAETVSYEVICVDDKSTDSTLKILLSYERKYSDMMMVIALDENGKQGRARNIALEYASGTYIMYVDADDVIADKMIETMYRAMIEYRCDMVECAYKSFVEKPDSLVEMVGEPELYDMNDGGSKRACILRHFHRTAPWGRLYKRKILENDDVFFPENITMEDTYFTELSMLHVERYVYIPNTLYFYYVNREGTYHSDRSLSYYMDSMQVQNWATDRVMAEGMAVDCPAEWEWLHFLKAFCELIMRMLKDRRFFSYENYLKLMEELRTRYPNAAENIYIRDTEAPAMAFSREISKRIYSEQELALLMYGENRTDIGGETLKAEGV